MRGAQALIAPVAHGVEAPGEHATGGEVDPLRSPIGAKAAHHVPGVKAGAAAASATPAPTPSGAVRGRQGGEQLLAPLGGGGGPGAHGIGAEREEKVPVGIDEPPLAIDFFHAEEAGGFGLRALVAAVLAVGEIALAERLILGGPGGLQLLDAGGLAGPIIAHPLAELIDQRLGFQQRVAGILVGQADRADFKPRRADGVGHHDADLAHRLQLARRAAEVDEHHGAGLIVDAGEIVARVRRLGEKTQRHGGANPGSGHGREAHRAHAARVVYAQVEALRRTEAQLQHQKLERTPIGGQGGVQVFQRPGDFRSGALEHGAPGLTAGGTRRGEKRGQHADPIPLHCLLPKR